jgi:hypothetical protein
MASRQASYDVLPGRGPYCVRLHGQVFHHLGGLRPDGITRPQYSQLYILDAAQALAQRIHNVLEPNVLEGLF